MKQKKYLSQLTKLQIELVCLQGWIQQQGLRVVVVFEGRDAAGKGGMIKAITRRLNPRIVKIAALGKPSDREKTQWYFQRYAAQLPGAGEMVLFDRSWYNRAGVEKVMGFCTDSEYQDFLLACPEFEDMLIRSGIIVIKYWLAVSDEKQEQRFIERLNTPLKRWKFSAMDLVSRSKWVEYSKAKDEMFEHTDTNISPWNVVNADHKKRARLNCIAHLLQQINYQKIPHETVELPIIDKSSYKRRDKHKQRFVPEKY
jgi:polyphosphate kinase 2